MKKWLPWIVTGLCAAWVAVAVLPKPESGFHTREFGRLPVLLNGRMQPWDSVARNALRQIRNKQAVALEDGRRMTASEWVLEMSFKPEIANERKVFRIDHPELLGLLKLPPDEKHFSFNQLKTSLAEIEKQAQRASTKEAPVQTTFEKQLLKLHGSLNLYHRLKNSLQPEDSTNFVAELDAFKRSIGPGVAALRAQEAGKEYDKGALDLLMRQVTRLDNLMRLAYPLVAPPVEPDAPKDKWNNIGSELLDLARGKELAPAVNYYAAMGLAYRESNPGRFNQAVADYQQWLRQQYGSVLSKASRELFYNSAQPFYLATTLYVLAFVLACLSWFNWSEWMRKSAFYIIALAFLIHTAGLVFRMVLEARPPVTNLYSSAIFIGWASVILGLILERYYRDGIGSVTAASIGFVTLIIAHNLAVGGDTMEMLRAVLDTNFWLATHVVTVTLGYAATFVAGFLAALYVLRGVFTRSLSAATAAALERMVYGIVCFATLFSFVGTVLGGIWADQSWGRFWGWDPKENGALIIVLWNAAILHARWGDIMRARGIMNMAIFGNVVTSFSWFGVNMLGIGLHSYGFMDEAFKWLMAFVISQLVLIGVGMIPLNRWASFKAAGKASSSRDKSAKSAAAAA